MKTLKQLWSEQGGPFWARYEGVTEFYVVALTPNQDIAIGWYVNGAEDSYSAKERYWQLCPDSTKPKPKPKIERVYGVTQQSLRDKINEIIDWINSREM